MSERDSLEPQTEPEGSKEGLEEEETFVYPVYVYERTYWDIFYYCRRAARKKPPREALGVILGFRRSWQDVKYVRVTDWATGRVEASMAYARFTPEGILEYRIALHDRYGSNPLAPRVIGLWHSHPFGSDPEFSAIDLRTFFKTPFYAEGNVFFLIDPISRIFKVFMLQCLEEAAPLKLERVDYCVYRPNVPLGIAPPSDPKEDSER
jgi:proteasome lid subunit RPN8/RPN11